MGLSMDHFLRINDVPADPPKPKPASTSVDASDRKFYVKAAENGNEQALKDFDAALRAQSNTPPPSPPAPSGPIYQPPANLTDQELAAQFAPALVLPGGDHDLPADPEDFIDNSRWRQDVPKLQEGVDVGWHFPPIKPKGDPEFGNNINADPTDDFTAADVGQVREDGQFLDLADNRRDIGSEDAPFFYQVSRSDNADEPTKVTYWFFYAYNDGPGPQNHEGDFERITVEIDPTTGQPRDAIYSAHSNKHTEPTPYDQLETYKDPETGEDTGRPLVYVATGSHASYPTAGNHTSDAPDARIVGGVVGGVPGAVGGHFVNERVLDDRTPGSRDQAAHVIDTGGNLHNVEAQPWYPSEGGGVHWGEPGNADDLPFWNSASSGPAGPSEEKQHVELEEDAPSTSGPPTGTTIPEVGSQAPSAPTPTTIPSPSPGTTTGG